ncbi:MAG: tRNA dihydrouridine synthase DusB [Erysipelotrichaceae bacterium]|nr:tRNA dihydrouridine synthase DusB [Erysipelotrichaceae bacterium]
MLKIGDLKIERSVIVAPLAGISNSAYRRFCMEYGAGLCVSEMVSDKAIYYHNVKTEGMLDFGNDAHPVALQIFGSDPETMANAAAVANNVDCDIIDINMGCPVSKVIKTGAGSALMRDEELACEIAKAVIKASKKPVTVKMRLGYDSHHLNYLSLAQKLEDIGISAVCLHARTRTQMYEGKADWNHVKILHDHLNIPVIGNGDIHSVDDYLRYRDCCDAIMIGRGLIGDPFLIRDINACLAGEEIKETGNRERIDACLKHTKMLIELKGETTGIREMRGIAPHYIAGLYNSAVYKNRMSGICTYRELADLLEEYYGVLEEKR